VKQWIEALEQRRGAMLYRKRRVVSSPQHVEMIVDGHPMLAFCSNDYLGLANHPEVVRAWQKAADRYGVGSGASHLINGHSDIHHALEEELADFTGRSRALLFSTGYMANQGVITGLLGKGDCLFQDRLNHASLVDAGALCRAKVKRYQHVDLASLKQQISRCKGSQRLLVTDGIFSMEGDLAPLPELAAIARQHQTQLMVDDAHGLGVLGVRGGGTLSHFGLTDDEVPILMGTLGKALGTFGAFVAGSEALVETLIQTARSYVYTTAIPPALAAATRVSLRLMQQDDWRRDRLLDLVHRFRRSAMRIGMPLADSVTPIQPILAGSAEQALSWSQELERQGILVTAIRPPTVPQGSARLRITFSALHTDQHLERLVSALAKLSRRYL
jgi:8-amino-7-oxononanoate synthase